MEDSRVWRCEESLWTGDAETYRRGVDEAAVMVVPAPPFVVEGDAAVKAVSDTPHWDSVEISERHVSRPQEGLIVVGYKVQARRDGHDDYLAHCTSTYRRRAHEDWTVVQHQQTPVVAPAAG